MKLKLVNWNGFNKLAKDRRNMLRKIIGLDIGTKHIGISVSDEDKMISFPLSVIRRDPMNRMSLDAIQSLSNQL
jgi:RNase H-fold protein (predicted Holliday junction resolvase)